MQTIRLAVIDDHFWLDVPGVKVGTIPLDAVERILNAFIPNDIELLLAAF